jgi:hypothetical protein
MDIYIETGQSRMGTFNNNTRKAMLWCLNNCTPGQFLADIGGEQFRIVVLLTIVSIMFCRYLSGLTVYGFFWKKFKAAPAKPQGRRPERYPLCAPLSPANRVDRFFCDVHLYHQRGFPFNC